MCWLNIDRIKQFEIKTTQTNNLLFLPSKANKIIFN